jgi:ectoine hydroxylase-related dioxygenase (phytanoyl-CoA dioxygenase family)
MTTVDSQSNHITHEHRRQFAEDGYFVLHSLIDPQTLAMLRDEADLVVRRKQEPGDNGRAPGKRYVSEHNWRERPALRSFAFGEIFADICRATLGPEAVLFYEQFVIKAGDAGAGFSWHQDSGYIRREHPAYVTCWCPLDDVDEANGTVFMLPWSKSGIKTYVQHVRDASAGDLVGYFGPERGEPVIARAGSIAVISSVLFHRSGPNQSGALRRVYMTQYAKEPIIGASGKQSGTAEPLLKGGAPLA